MRISVETFRSMRPANTCRQTCYSMPTNLPRLWSFPSASPSSSWCAQQRQPLPASGCPHGRCSRRTLRWLAQSARQHSDSSADETTEISVRRLQRPVAPAGIASGVQAASASTPPSMPVAPAASALVPGSASPAKPVAAVGQLGAAGGIMTPDEEAAYAEFMATKRSSRFGWTGPGDG
jgi:hypothetical protein